MNRKRKRLVLIASALSVTGLAVGLMLFALRDNVVFFYSPTELIQKAVKPGTNLRIGGLVKKDTVVKSADQQVTFVVTDLKTEVSVAYAGLLPDLFREGQGVVIEGTLAAPGQFHATTVLAKHDETYMPRDVADKLKEQGVWQGAGPAGRPKS